MAKKTAQVDVKVTGAKSLQDIEQELSAINEELSTMDINSQAFADMAVQAQQLDGELQGVNQQLSFISPAEQADGFLKMGEGIFGAVAAVQGLSAAFGVENEKVEETIKKLVGMIAAMDGIRKVSEALQRENLAKLGRGFQSIQKVAQKSFRAVGTSITTANKKMASMVGVSRKTAAGINTALASIGILLIITAITLLIQNWEKVVSIFKKSEDSLESAADGLARIEEESTALNLSLDKLSDQLNNVNQTFEDINNITLSSIFARGQDAIDLYEKILDAEEQLSKQRKGTIEFLETENKLLELKVELEDHFFLLSNETNEIEKNRIDNDETTLNLTNQLLFLKVDNIKLDKEKEKINQKIKDSEWEIYKINEDLLTANRLRSRILKKDRENAEKDIEDNEVALKLVQDEINRINGLIKNFQETLLKIDLSIPAREALIKYNILYKQLIDSEDALAEFRKEKYLEWLDFLSKEINKTSTILKDIPKDVITNVFVKPLGDARSEFRKFIDETREWTEDMGGNIAEFTNEFILPLANEMINLLFANSDLFAAEQQHIIGLAELEINTQQDIVDAKIEAQQELQDQIDENNDKILGWEELLKDANAERFAEIQEAIKAEEQANIELQKQKEAAFKAEEAALQRIADENFDIAHAAWEISKSDAETSKVTAGIQGALAILQALAAPFPLNLALPAIIGIATKKQLNAIDQTIGTYKATEPQRDQFAEGGILNGASHDAGGIPIEAEHGEYLINKHSTAQWFPLIEAINNSGRPKYADGGRVPNITSQTEAHLFDYDLFATKIKEGIQPVVSVVEISDVQNQVNVIESNASF